jgi:hypothetical protein
MNDNSMSANDLGPTKSAYNAPDLCLPNTVFSGELALANMPAAMVIATSDFLDLGGSEFRTRIPLTTPDSLRVPSLPVPITDASISSFRIAVMRVVGGGSKEEMVGPDAISGIAVVADAHALGDRTVNALPSEAMRLENSMALWMPELTIAMGT